jgi:predicted ATPase/DNA-binding SARP family transcriptional activator
MVRIGILGPLAVWDDGDRSVEISGLRLRTLLARLAIDAGRVVGTETLVDDLWPDGPPASAANALQALVSRLRSAIGRDRIESRPGGYVLVLAEDGVDAVRFERQAADGKALLAAGDAAGAVRVLRQALGLWRGPVLPELATAAFARQAAVRLDVVRRDTLQDRIDADFALGRAALLVAELEELVAADPLAEGFAARLMRALYVSGRQAAALEVFERTRRMLADDLGVDPSEELAAVHLAILRRDPGLGVVDGALGERWERRTNLVAQLTSFVGREAEQARVGDLLARGRLVTITGPGGAGKTRLAVETAALYEPDMPDGVWFVPLAPVTEAVDIPRAVMIAMGVADQRRLDAVPALERLVSLLERRRLILVLDNCEHLVEATARFADRILGAAPGLRVLATSREPLGITGEMLCPLPPLALPPPAADATRAMEYAAVRLLCDRAAAARPGFAVDAENVEPVVRICRALDGIPLAIELAAARFRALTPVQIADRLDDRFRLLSSGNRAAAPRHQTLRAVVDWSWDLLEERECAVLRRLSVFAGGAGPDAAEHVCGVGGGVDDVIDAIASLIDKSLVVADGGSEVRYRLLETVRAYAAERLGALPEEERSVRAAHSAWFLDLAERAEPELRRRDQQRWVVRLTAERDNCHAALRRAIDTGDATTALRFLAALTWFWLLCDYEAEAAGWAAEVAEIAGDGAPAGAEDAYAFCTVLWTILESLTGDKPDLQRLGDLAARTETLVTGASHPVLALAPALLAVFTGDREGGTAALAEVREHPDPWVRAAARCFAGYSALNDARLDEAAVELPGALAEFQAIGDRWGAVIAGSGTGWFRMLRGDYDGAVSAFAEAHRCAGAEIGDDRGAVMQIQLGWALMFGGDKELARRHVIAGTESAHRIGEYADEAVGLVMLAEIERREGALDAAHDLLRRAMGVIEPRSERVDVAGAVVRALTKLGCVREQMGDLERAATLHQEALEVAYSRPMLFNTHAIADVTAGIAALTAARGDHVRAAELLGAAHAILGCFDASCYEIDRTRETVLDVIGPEAFAAALDRGMSTPRDRIPELQVEPV